MRLEGAALALGALLAYAAVGRSWWLVPLTLLLPDITMAGYLGGARLGSWSYNLGHSTPLPAALVGIGIVGTAAALISMQRRDVGS